MVSGVKLPAGSVRMVAPLNQPSPSRSKQRSQSERVVSTDTWCACTADAPFTVSVEPAATLCNSAPSGPCVHQVPRQSPDC
jgi:hypothetical protein